MPTPDRTMATGPLDVSAPSRSAVAASSSQVSSSAAAPDGVMEDIDYESLPTGSGWGVHMLAGAMAGISEHAAIYPLDSIKTRMQILPSLQPILGSSSASAAASGSHLPIPPAQTILQHIRAVSSTEGIRTLWRGVASVVMGAGPAHAAHFGTYEFVREVSGGREDGMWGFLGTAGAGAAATIASDALMNPFDVIKQRMQMRNSVHRSVVSCAKTLYRTEGIQAFYISYPTTLTMNIPLSAVQFSVYEAVKSYINPSGEYSPATHCIAGGIAGGTAAAVTTPLDVAKTLLQTRGTSDDPKIRNARSMWQALGIIWERDGWRGLKRGIAPRVMTFAPSTAISWMSYEFFKVLIREQDILPKTGAMS